MVIMKSKVGALASALLVFALIFLAVNCSDDNGVDSNGDINTGDTILVPTDQPNIQAAINVASNGQVVVVEAGTYSGPGNRDLVTAGKELTIMSADGPAATIIDCGGTADSNHQAFAFTSRETFRTIVDGFTIRGGYIGNGGAIECRSSSPTIRNCIFENNYATASGGAIRCKAASPTILNSTFYGNGAPAGGVVFAIAGATPQFENCILSYSTQGEAAYCSESTSQITLTCCDVYGNSGGDWVDCIADQAGANGNFSLDPNFCDAGAGDFRLQSNSPCSGLNNDCQILIGALDVGCGN